MVVYTECYFTLEKSLSGAVKLTKNADPDNILILEMLLNFMQMEIFRYLMVVDLLKTQ